MELHTIILSLSFSLYPFPTDHQSYLYSYTLYKTSLNNLVSETVYISNSLLIANWKYQIMDACTVSVAECTGECMPNALITVSDTTTLKGPATSRTQQISAQKHNKYVNVRARVHPYIMSCRLSH